jgi:hypothetical protein
MADQDPWAEAAKTFKAPTTGTATPAKPTASTPTSDPWAEAAQSYKDTSTSEAAPATPSLWDRIKGIPQAWEEQMAPVDQALAPQASDGTFGTAAHNVLGTAASTLLAPVMHPVDTAKGLATAALKSSPLGMVYELAHGGPTQDRQQQADAVADPARTLETGAGQLLGMGAAAGLGGLADASTDAIARGLEPNTRVSAMEGFRIPSGSPKAEPLLGKIELAKPYLQGTDSLKDLQSRLPAAKSEVYQPYEDFINANRHASIDGPNGPSTIGDLYDRDKEITAQLGQIKSDPLAMQQAAQKGLNQADLINEQKAIRSKLFPAAEDAGVKASEINKTYGALKSVEKSVAGKNTDLVPNEPMGVGRIRNLSIKQPFKAIDEILPALRDINQGRFWSGNPVDLGIRDTFANAGPKPDLGQYEPLPRLQLPAQASPITLGEPHEFTAPYTPRTAGRLLGVENPQENKPITSRKYGVKTGTDKGVLGSVLGEGRI